MIRVCVVDDQALVRGGITALLNLYEGIDVIAEGGDGVAAVDLVLAHRPDVLLLDVRMPKRNGIEALRALANANALPPTLLLTTFEDDVALVEGVRAGARGYILKGVEPDVLVEAIKTVSAGGTYLFATAPPAQPDASGAPDEPPLEPLTPREREILKLMTSGISNREIADALNLSEGTVRNHASSIFSKLGVRDRTQAALQALHRGLV